MCFPLCFPPRERTSLRDLLGVGVRHKTAGVVWGSRKYMQGLNEDLHSPVLEKRKSQALECKIHSNPFPSISTDKEAGLRGQARAMTRITLHFHYLESRKQLYLGLVIQH